MKEFAYQKKRRTKHLSLFASGLVGLSTCFSSLHGAVAELVRLDTPLGPIFREVTSVAPEGTLVDANPLTTSSEFRPPSIFSAPLPSGSGARALGLGGAFTAVADDATAASWNPAGLINLESAEASFVLRASTEKQKHSTTSKSLSVGEDEFSNFTLNYLSLVFPFRAIDRNFVFSANYQEAYDFEQRFTANLNEIPTTTFSANSSEGFSETITDGFMDSFFEVNLSTEINTTQKSTVRQTLETERITSLDFDQEGVVDAISPALAVEINPKLYFGVAFNFYQNSLVGDVIKSRSFATFTETQTSVAKIEDTQDTTGIITFDGSIGIPFSTNRIPFGPSSTNFYFSESSSRTIRETIHIDGEVEEINAFDEFQGFNTTLGALWTVSRVLSLGFSIDLPWTAEAKQERTTRTKQTVFDRNRTQILDQSSSEVIEKKDVEFDFPLFWSLGAVLRLSDRLYTSFDVSQTMWSDFAFEAQGQGKINPLDGSADGVNDIDDTWSFRGGIEYLIVLQNTEIPLRGGAAWEQRPAIGTPDEYWHFSLGSGLSLGKGNDKIIIDIAYIATLADDVLESLVPGQELTTDVVEHQGFISMIKHF